MRQNCFYLEDSAIQRVSLMLLQRNEMVQIIARIDGRRVHDVNEKVRSPKFEENLQAVIPDGLKQRRYPAKELLRARLLLAALDCGFRYEDLAILNEKLESPMGLGEWIDSGIANMSGLDCIIHAAQNDVIASIEIEIGYSEGRKIIRCAVVLENYNYPFRAWNALSDAEGVKVLSRISIPASMLAREVAREVGC